MTAKIIGLYSSVPQSGKSTIAKHLILQHGFKPLPFAQPLRDMLTPLLQTLGLSEHQIGYHLHQDKSAQISGLGCNARHLLQTLGTEWGRELVCSDLWIKCWAAQAITESAVVSDDVRFRNEAFAIKMMGGEVWKVWRPGAELDCPHASEGALDDWDGFDRLIVNDSDLHQLIRDVDACL